MAEIRPKPEWIGRALMDLGMRNKLGINVVAIRNGDDHAKNFSFLLREGGRWELAPAYDLTDTHFSDGPWSTWTDTHALSVNGKHSGITDADLLAVADRFGIGTARDVLARVKDAVRVTLPPSP